MKRILAAVMLCTRRGDRGRLFGSVEPLTEISRHSWSGEERLDRVSLRGSTSVAVVPVPGEDSSSNRPPNDNIRSRILKRPNPDVGECAFLLGSARSKPAPWSEI